MARLKLPTKTALAAPFRSRKAFWEMPNGPTKTSNPRPSNRELGNGIIYHYIGSRNQFSIVGWNTGSSLITMGLTWQQSFVSVCLGSFLTAIVVVLMARPGAKYHIGFASGLLVCIIWYGIQTFYAGNILSVMFRCMFGRSWENFPDTLPADGAITSKQLLAFFIAWILQFPFVSRCRMAFC
ncbi:hypothetical protein BST61_g8110 [Cercospora zeina]